MITLSYHDENALNVIGELQNLFAEHYDELCVTKEFPLEPDYDAYRALNDAGRLRFISCRADGVVIGYAVFFLQPHLHYKSCMTAFEDVYFIKKEWRRGRVGIKLFQYAEEALKRIGVKRIIMHTKVHLDNSRLLEYLKYKKTDYVFSKMI